MASLLLSLLPVAAHSNLLALSSTPPSPSRRRWYRPPSMSNAAVPRQEPPKLVTFLGKGGSGKTSAAILAAQYYAKVGLRTCLVIHSQDPTAEYLMGYKLGNSPTMCRENLSAVKLETSKMLLEPLKRLKQADARYNITQGILQGVVGEELGVLPGMDSVFSLISIIKLLGYFDEFLKVRRKAEPDYEMIVYDGLAPESTLRMICSFSQASLYMKYLRQMAEKTDMGRLTAPSVLNLLEEAVAANSSYQTSVKSSSELWEIAEQALHEASLAFTRSSRFGCYLVMNPSRRVSVDAALRYWGCAIQAGAHVSGAFRHDLSSNNMVQDIEKDFLPMQLVHLPFLSSDHSVDWDAAVENLSKEAKSLLSITRNSVEELVTFDTAKKAVTLFMPGFDKSEIKLFQYRGGSELLIEAGDQRRVIQLPSNIQGKVGAAKFSDRRLIVTLK